MTACLPRRALPPHAVTVAVTVNAACEQHASCERERATCHREREPENLCINLSSPRPRAAARVPVSVARFRVSEPERQPRRQRPRAGLDGEAVARARCTDLVPVCVRVFTLSFQKLKAPGSSHGPQASRGRAVARARARASGGGVPVPVCKATSESLNGK